MAFRPMRIDFTPPRVPGTFHVPSKSSNGLSLDQLLKLQAVMAQKSSHHSFWDDVKKGVGGLSWVFDKILRPSYAVASAADFGSRSGGFNLGEALHGAREGFMGRSKEGFGQVFDKWGILQGHRTLRGIAGFATDVVTDPTTALMVAAAPVTGGLSLSPLLAKAGIRVGEEAVAKTAAFKAGKALLDDSFVAHTPEEAQHLLPEAQSALHDLQAGGASFDFRKALGLAHVDILSKQAAGQEIGAVEAAKLSAFRRGALEEEMAKTPKALQLRAGIPFTNKHVPLTPGLIPIPKSLPFGGKVTGVLSKAFRPGAENPEMHGYLMTGRHVGEQLAGDYMNVAHHAFNGIDINTADALDALGRFEKKGGVIRAEDPHTGEVSYHLNPERMQGLTKAQQAYAEAWHSVVEHIRKTDEAFGVKYKGPVLGEKGQLYVPHITNVDDVTMGGNAGRKSAIAKLTTEKGFQKPRRANSTVEMLQAVHAMGKVPKGIIADPMELLARRVRASASKQADQLVVDALKKSQGLPARLVNGGKVTKAQRALTKAQDNLAKLSPMNEAERAQVEAELKDLRIADVHKEHDAILAQLQKNHNRIKFGPKKQTKNATLARIQKAIEAHPAKREAAIQAVHAGEDSKLAGIHRALDNAEKAKAAQHKVAIREVKGLQAVVDKAAKGVPHPNIENAKKAGWIKPEGFDHYFPPKVAHQIDRVVRVYQGDDEMIQGLSNSYRKYLSSWKLLVTSVNPGYRARNTMTDFWNMWVAGVPTRGIVTYGFKAAKMMRNAKTGADKLAQGQTLSKTETHALREMNDAYSQGVLSGLYQGDIQQLRRYLEHHGSKRSLAKDKKFLHLGEKVAQDLNRNAENWGRVVHYLYRREGQKMGVARAAREVRLAHFDYEDLTEIERRKFKALLPFYTWTRKNIPFQLRQLASRPGRYAAFPKLANESEYASGDSSGDILPGWMKHQFAFKTPWGYHVPQFGVSDLAVFNGDAKDHLLGMITPAIKVPVELATGKNLSTGIPLKSDRHPRMPVSNFAADVFGAIPGNPFNVGTTERAGHRGAGAGWLLPYLGSQLPLTNYLINSRSTIKTKQRGVGGDLSYLTGLNLRQLDNETTLTAMLQQIADEVAKKKRGYRDEGLIPEVSRKKSPFEAYLREQASTAFGR